MRSFYKWIADQLIKLARCIQEQGVEHGDREMWQGGVQLQREAEALKARGND